MDFGCVQRRDRLARDVTSAPSWMSAGELHVEWRDGEDVFTNIIIIINGRKYVKTDCLHEM